MFLRLFLLLQLFSLMGPGSGANAGEPVEQKTGSEGIGKVIQFLFYLGVLILIVIILLGLFSIAGNFKISHLDPRT
jgi:hypothetical protein